MNTQEWIGNNYTNTAIQNSKGTFHLKDNDIVKIKAPYLHHLFTK